MTTAKSPVHNAESQSGKASPCVVSQDYVTVALNSCRGRVDWGRWKVLHMVRLIASEVNDVAVCDLYEIPHAACAIALKMGHRQR